VPDCKPNVAAPNSNAIPSRDEASLFIDNAFLSDIELHTTFRNGHAAENVSRKGAKRFRVSNGILFAIAPLREKVCTDLTWQVCWNDKNATPQNSERFSKAVCALCVFVWSFS
jgi:hypothetical protein